MEITLQFQTFPNKLKSIKINVLWIQTLNLQKQEMEGSVSILKFLTFSLYSIFVKKKTLYSISVKKKTLFRLKRYILVKIFLVLILVRI